MNIHVVDKDFLLATLLTLGRLRKVPPSDERVDVPFVLTTLQEELGKKKVSVNILNLETCVTAVMMHNQNRELYHVAAMLVWYAKTPHSGEHYGPPQRRFMTIKQIAAFLHNAAVIAHSHIGASHLQPIKSSYDQVPGRVLSLKTIMHPLVAQPGRRPRVIPHDDYRPFMDLIRTLLTAAIQNERVRQCVLQELAKKKYQKGKLFKLKRGKYE